MLIGLLDLIIYILLSVRFHLFLALVIYYFMPDSWTLSVWFYVFLLANAWDISSTYTFVYVYRLGWENEANDLIHWFAEYTNYHWAVVLQTLMFYGPIALFCIFWPWSGFSICVLILCSVRMFIAGMLNFLLPVVEWLAGSIDHRK